MLLISVAAQAQPDDEAIDPNAPQPVAATTRAEANELNAVALQDLISKRDRALALVRQIEKEIAEARKVIIGNLAGAEPAAQGVVDAIDLDVPQPTATGTRGQAANVKSRVHDTAATTQVGQAASQDIPAGDIAKAAAAAAAAQIAELGSDTYDPATTTAIPAEPVLKAQGRVKLPPSSEPSPLSHLSICEKAQVARARNSPAAPGLEAQCRAQK